jgi:hypothetical protein
MVGLFRKTIEGFLKRLKRTRKEGWNSLRESLRDRCFSKEEGDTDSGHCFIGKTKACDRGKPLAAMGGTSTSRSRCLRATRRLGICALSRRLLLAFGLQHGIPQGLDFPWGLFQG